ncbi:uncharacterized protein LOC122498636 [Leptopilina heterotoma]|uniref:uncharacterized protein LOC122498636 n=1 Tax=Leptopilina heterotoma TaxID=63436 RepID=UPI001CA8AE67|nr:uncharacterized protein LOC122498636 [Leptopilina heterotoma]
MNIKGGTKLHRFQPVVDFEYVAQNNKFHSTRKVNKFHCITLMKLYINKSFEELRFEDYSMDGNSKKNGYRFSSPLNSLETYKPSGFKFNSSQLPISFGQTNTTASTSFLDNSKAFQSASTMNVKPGTSLELQPRKKDEKTGSFDFRSQKIKFQNTNSSGNSLTSSLQQTDPVQQILTELSVKLNNFEGILTSALGRIDTMENDVKQIKTYVSLVNKRLSYQDDKKLLSKIDEIEDRMRRESNVILFGLPEADSVLTFKEKYNCDRDKIIAILNTLLPDNVPKIETVQRFGKQSEMAPQCRPLRVTFVDKQSVKDVTAAFKKLKMQQEQLPENIPDSLSISWDKTRIQLKEYKKVRMELDRRLANGEEGICINYKNGNPVIVPQRL